MYLYLFIYFNRFFFWVGGGGGFNNQAQSSGVNLMTFIIKIGKGRHTLPKTPENLWICPICHLNEVEHELHFLFNCNLYDGLLFDLTFTEKLVIDIPFLTLFIFNNIDPISIQTYSCLHTCTFMYGI